jgi:hypothetical protein
MSSIYRPTTLEYHMAAKDKEQHRQYVQAKRKERRERWLSENGPCHHCGSWHELEMHHIDKSLKEDHRVWSWSEEHLLIELAKCIVLCHKCHKKLHKPISKHGTRARYKRGCRCRECTTANTLWFREYKHRRRTMLGRNAKEVAMPR